MKRLIFLMLIVPAYTFALPIPSLCRGGGSDYIAIRYLLWNDSDYSIGLKFDKARHGLNPSPGSIYLEPDSGPVEIYGCSNGIFTGYETRATLTASEYYSVSDVEMAYLYIDNPFSGNGRFSYEKYNMKVPECSCKVRAGGPDWTDLKKYHDCSSFNGPMKERVQIDIFCK